MFDNPSLKNTFIGLDGCDPQALVEISQQFTALDLELPHPTTPTPATTRPSTSDKADWNAVANAMGNVYQALCNNECNAALQALQSIERILERRGINVQQPTMTTRVADEGPLPIEAEFNYDE
jgi:hypothetical protein